MNARTHRAARMCARGLLAAACIGGALAGPAAARAQTQTQMASYSIDPTHTSVGFEVLHFNTSLNRARWGKPEGVIEFDRSGKSGRVDIRIDMNGVNSGVPRFDGFLRGKDFFDVEHFPSARFVGERFVFSGDKLSEVQGALTLMGRTHPLVLKAVQFNCYVSPLFKREVCGGDFEGTVQRSLYGISYGLPAIAPDHVRLWVQVEAIKLP